MLKLAIVFTVVTVYCVEAQFIRYYLSTRNTWHAPDRLLGFGEWPSNVQFNQGANTIFLIHGHGGSEKSQFNTLIKETIFVHTTSSLENIVVVDWEFDAQYNYSVSSARVPFVARELEEFIRWFSEETGLNVHNIHLVGFDLGAHVAGIASRWLSQSNRNIGRVSRITGLNPPGNGWDGLNVGLRHNDANYVEVIYTDDSGPQANGIGNAIGRVNFYANGGSNQPGCLTHSCSHNRAYELFAASILDQNCQWGQGGLVGYLCNSMTQMNLNMCSGIHSLCMGGIYTSKTGVSGIYRINTNGNWPFQQWLYCE